MTRLVVALLAMGCGARSEIRSVPLDGAVVAEASAEDAAAFSCPPAEPILAASCPVEGYQCFYFRPAAPTLDVFFCEGGGWQAGTPASVIVPTCADVACINVPSQCIMGACTRCTCGTSGFYDACSPC